MTPRIDLSATLRELADLAAIRGASSDAECLDHAAAAIAGLGEDAFSTVARLARRNRLSELPGISPSLHDEIRHLLKAGRKHALGAALARVPRLIHRLLDLSALSSQDARRLVRDLEVATLSDLQSALDDGRLGQHTDAVTARKLKAASEALALDGLPLTLGRACELLESLLPAIAEACPHLEGIEPSGDVRRFEPAIRDLVLVGRASDPEAALDSLCAVPVLDDVLCRGARRAIVLYRGVEVDVRIPDASEFGSLLFTTTGSRAHVTVVARRSGPAPERTEERVYAQAGLPYIPPELRQGAGEIEAAGARQLPILLERRDIRGDLHMHTSYSDGRDSLEAMVAACLAMGHEYIAITDHSQGAAASRTLKAGDILRQRAEIDRMRELYPSISILHGIEVDIRPDGRLDFGDSVLEQFDVVLASLHDRAGQDGPRLTARCLQAMRHPLVTILAHPSNRLVGRSPGYPLDFETIYAAAAETSTALEIDGAPGHLDLEGSRAREAARAGATIVVNSDSHRATSLDRQMRFGVGTARRGWIERRHVLNTRPLSDVLGFITAKRAGSR
ncbi:MAG TPA: PHP domain-containing protein [Vicinamibacterales bacterium]|nr:PHP domain-containing protein [Vicinamibacterales bacterium]